MVLMSKHFVGVVALMLLGGLPACSFSDAEDDKTREAVDGLTHDQRWVRVLPRWICDGDRCGAARVADSEAKSYYLQLAHDGRARRAYANIPYPSQSHEGSLTIRCQSGSWSIDGGAIELRFPQSSTEDPAIDERRSLNRFALDFVRATREGRNELDYEDWQVGGGELPELGLDAPCPLPAEVSQP